MDREEMRRIAREERDRDNIDSLPFRILGSVTGSLIDRFTGLDWITWLLLLTLVHAAFFAFLLESMLAFLIMFGVLFLCSVYFPYLLAAILPTAFVSVMVILSMESPAIIGPGAPTVFTYMQGIGEAFWIWLAILLVGLLMVYRTRRA